MMYGSAGYRRLNALETARALLDHVTPLTRDCGTLCRKACCLDDGSGENGMRLFPGEEHYYTDDADFILREDGRILCRGTCRRETRPLACRVFPLVFTPDGRVKPDIRAYPVCPLMAHGMRGLSGEFVRAARTAACALCKDARQAAFLLETAKEIAAYEALKDIFNRG